jgi:hypothetical protein
VGIVESEKEQGAITRTSEGTPLLRMLDLDPVGWAQLSDAPSPV